MSSRTNAHVAAAPRKVVIAVVHADGKFLLVHRKQAEGKLGWSFPGGKIELGESELAAAEREVLEETGVQCKAVRKVGQRRHPDTGRLVTYVLCDYVNGKAHNTEPDKATQVRWLKPTTVMSRLTSHVYAPVKALLSDVAQAQEQPVTMG